MGSGQYPHFPFSFAITGHYSAQIIKFSGLFSGNEDPVFHGKGGDFDMLKLEESYMPFESSSRVLVGKVL